MYSTDDQDDAFMDATRSFDDLSPLAYVRPVQTEKGMAYGVFASDGTQLALFGSREAAYFAAKQHDLDPVLIH